MPADIIVPHDGDVLPARLVILLVGPSPWPGMYKNQLALALLKCQTDCSVRIITTRKLPFRNTKERSAIEYIVFMLDLNNKNCQKIVESSIKYVDTRYFTGKSCFVLARTGDVQHESEDYETVQSFINTFDSTTIYFNPLSKASVDVAAQRIFTLAKIAAGMTPTCHVSVGTLFGSQPSVQYSEENINTSLPGRKRSRRS